METCKICGKEFKNLGVHIKNAHNLSTRDYENYEVKIEELPDEPERVTITPKEMQEAIFGKEEDILLSEFLEKYELTKKELVSLIKRYKTGSAIPVTQMQERRMKIAAETADKYKDQNEVTVNSVAIAETLVKNYNFKVISVKSGQPKTWFLKKN